MPYLKTYLTSFTRKFIQINKQQKKKHLYFNRIYFPADCMVHVIFLGRTIVQLNRHEFKYIENKKYIFIPTSKCMF